MKTYALITTCLVGSLCLPFGSAMGQSEASVLRQKNAQQAKHISALEKEVERLYTLLDRETKRTGSPRIARSNSLKTPENCSVYVVKSGDTLSRISRTHNVNLSTLMSSNGLNSKSIIRVGQKITIPRKGISQTICNKPTQKAVVISQPSLQVRQYHVTAGDTLYGIARRHNTTVATITSLNPQLNGSTSLKIGQKLNITGTAVNRTVVKNTVSQLPPLPALPTKKKASVQNVSVTKEEITMSKLPQLPETEYLTKDIVFSDFAKKHNTTVAQLNKINGWNYPPSTVLARESEIYLPRR